MQHFNKPYYECLLLTEPQKIYDLLAWDDANKKYLLKNDDEKEVWVEHHEFIPFSFRFREYCEAGPDGQIMTVAEAMDKHLDIKVQKPAPSSQVPHSPGPAKQSAPRTKTPVVPKDTGPAREKVRELLAPCKTREDIAAVAGPHLKEEVDALIAKYAHLDNGRFRMVIGNRLVSLFKA